MKVDSNIPPPKPRNKGITKTLRERVEGDSWLVDSSSIHSWLSVAYTLGVNITVRKDPDRPGKHRIWREA